MDNIIKKIDFSFLDKIVKKYKNLAIVIKGSPDPDALAGSFFLYKFFTFHNLKSNIYLLSELSLKQNIMFVEVLDIPFCKINMDGIARLKEEYEGYVIVDFKNPILDNDFKCVLHIDHHIPMDIPDDFKIDYQIIIEEFSSISTFFTLALKLHFDKFTEPDIRKLATGFYYGLYTDTNSLSMINAIDEEVLVFLKKYYNSFIIEQINEISFSEYEVQLFTKAIFSKVKIEDWVISSVGVINELNRDSIALIADLFIKRKPINLVLISALIKKEDSYIFDVSIRTTIENILDSLIKDIAKNGGASTFKGAFQINLGFVENAQVEELHDICFDNLVKVIRIKKDDTHNLKLNLKEAIQEEFRSLLK